MTLLASLTHSVPPAVTVVFAALLVGLILCLALEEKLHAKKSLIAGIFAVVSLFLGAACGILPFEEIVVGSFELVEHDKIEGEALVESGVEPKREHVSIPPVLEEDEEDLPAEEEGVAVEGDEATLEDEPPEVPEVHALGHRLTMPVYIPGIDWGVIAIIVGSSLFVDVASKSGLFTWIAIKVTKASAGDPRTLLWFYGIMTVVFSAVLNNVTAMIIVGSLTVVSLEKLGQRDKLLGFLLVEALLTNIGGLLTLISSVPNILVGTAAGISFVEFFIKSSPFVAVATWCTIALGARRFHIARLQDETERRHAREQVETFDERDGLDSRGFFVFSTVMLVLFILVIATTSVLPWIRNLEMGFVALSFAAIMLLTQRSTVDRFYKAIDWDLIGFFMALFVVIYVMEHARVLEVIGIGLQQLLALGDVGGTGALLVSSAVFSSVTDNIPLAAMLAKILVSLGTESSSLLWWAVIFGANLGGNLTPIGSASTLVAVTIMHKHGLSLSFGGFVVRAVPFAVLQILLAIVYVLGVLRWF